MIATRLTISLTEQPLGMDLKRLLEEKEMANDETTEHHSEYSFYVSDAAEKFRKFANTVMPFDVPTTNVVNIEEY